MGLAGIFHPDFFYMPRRSLNTTQIVEVEVYERTGETTQWTPVAGMSGNIYNLVWRSNARLQPNKDWRARPREFSKEFDDVHAVRIQLPIGKNLFGAEYDPLDPTKIIAYGVDPDWAKDYEVRVVSSRVTGTERLDGTTYVVRNAINSGNAWLYNLLCDVGTKAQ